MQTLKSQKYFLILFFFSLFLKFLFFFKSNGLTRLPVEDSIVYLRNGIEIFDNGFFSNYKLTGRPPLLSILISIFLSIFEQDKIVPALRIFFIFFTSLVPVIFFLNLKLMQISTKKSFLISLIISIYPPSIYYSSYILTENIVSVLLAFISYLILYLIILKKNKNKLEIYLLLGFLFSLLTLTRPIFILLPFYICLIFLIFNFFFSKDKVLNIKFLFLALLFYCLLLVPYTLVNKIKHNQFIVVTDRFASLLYLCNSDYNNEWFLRGAYFKTKKFEKTQEFLKKHFNKREKDAYLVNNVVIEIDQNLEKLPKILINRFINTLHFKPDPYKNFRENKSGFSNNDIVMFIYWVPIMILFFFHLLKRYENYKLINLVLISYVIFTALPFWGTPRFRFPIDNLIILNSMLFLFNTNFMNKNFFKIYK